MVVPGDVDQSVGDESGRIEAKRDPRLVLCLTSGFGLTFDLLGVMPATPAGFAAVRIGVFSGVAIIPKIRRDKMKMIIKIKKLAFAPEDIWQTLALATLLDDLFHQNELFEVIFLVELAGEAEGAHPGEAAGQGQE